MPLVGPILRKIILSRFAASFAMMYSSGITVLDAIRSCEEIVGNKALEQALRAAGQQIAEGKNLSSAFQDLALFPPLVIRMMRIGENTGVHWLREVQGGQFGRGGDVDGMHGWVMTSVQAATCGSR